MDGHSHSDIRYLTLPVLRASFLIFLFLSIPAIAYAEDCTDSVVIDSITYAVPIQWCGDKLDSIDIADPMKLVRIPEEYSFEEYRIYVQRDTRDAFVAMAVEAKKVGFDLITDSGFRSARFQKKIFIRRLAEGKTFEQIASVAAPPGYSQHETGRALDLVPSEARFAHTKIYEWLTDNAFRFGFYETFPKDSTSVHPWESWHWEFRPIE